MVRAFVFAAALAVMLAGCAPVEGEVASAKPSSTGTVSGTLFVANKRGDSLSKIDLETGLTEFEVEACRNPHELATSPDGKYVAVACYGGEHISIFETERLMRSARILLGKGARPHGIVWHEDGDIFVTAEGRQSIYSIKNPLSQSPEIVEQTTGQLGSHMLAVSPDESLAWTTDLGSKTVTRIDLTGRLKPFSIEVGKEPEGIALSPDGKTLWVSARGSDKAFALDPISLVVRAELNTDRFPLRLVIRPQGNFAVTSNLADGSLTVIDTKSRQVVRTIAVSSATDAEKRQQVTILWSDDGKRIYVAETGSDTVAEVDFASGIVLRRLKTGAGGDGLAILP